jgi:hypothetical protein
MVVVIEESVVESLELVEILKMVVEVMELVEKN